jgi:hypothetical protein
MTGLCPYCNREIEVDDSPDGYLKRHGRHANDRYPCPGSGGTFRRVPPKKAAKTPGVGKAGVAPCGHPGEHVTAMMVVCPLGCPVPSRGVGSLYACPHAVRMTWAGTTSCRSCGKVFERP